MGIPSLVAVSPLPRVHEEATRSKAESKKEAKKKNNNNKAKTKTKPDQPHRAAGRAAKGRAQSQNPREERAEGPCP